MGLLDIYGENPHERRIKATGAMFGNSGFAKPALAYVMGREMGGAEEWDREKGEAVSRTAKDAADRDWAQKIMGQVVELSKKDAVAATQVLKAESARNSYLAPYSGIQFNAETTAEGWTTYTDGTGQGWQQYLPALNKRNEDGSPLSDEQLEQQGFRRKIGAPKPAESPKTPYTKGKREAFVGQGGFDYEGTYQGQDDKGEPVFSSIVKKAKGGDGSGGALTGKEAISEFRQHITQLDSMYGRKASIQKGYDPVNNMVIPQTQIADALKSVDPQIQNLEAYVSKTFPSQWRQYKQPPAPPQKPLQSLATGPEVPLSAAPKTQHPLTGREAGIYRVNGRVVKWDGSKELQ